MTGGVAHAQVCNSSTNWISRHVFAGTPNEDIPVATAVRVWGPTDEAFVLYERRFPSADDDPHRGDNVFHVGYVQTPQFVINGTHTDGDTIISTRLYTECQ